MNKIKEETKDDTGEMGSPSSLPEHPHPTEEPKYGIGIGAFLSNSIHSPTTKNLARYVSFSFYGSKCRHL
jgi:hypothetical protein